MGDKRHGEGKITFADGTTQVGEYHYDRYITSCDTEIDNKGHGAVYENTVNSPPAEKEVILPDGSIYVGDLQDELPHGRGKLLHTNGFVASGAFLHGVLYNGVRYKFMPNRDVYEEKVVNGVKELATLTLHNGNVLVGDWVHVEEKCSNEKAVNDDV